MHAVCIPHRRILSALKGLWEINVKAPIRSHVARFSDNPSGKSPGFAKQLGRLRTAGYVDYPSTKTVALTEIGVKEAKADAVAESTTNASFHGRTR